MSNTLDYKILVLFATIFLAIILLPLMMNRISKTEHHGGFFEKYYLADRRVSGIVLAITLMSTYGSASTFLGGPGVAYKLGYGWVLLAVIQVVTGYFVLLVLAKKFKNAAQKINAITISDYLRNRYESKLVAFISTLAMIVFLIAAMSAQWVGGAKLLAAFMGIEYKTGIVLISVIIIFCVVFGGLKNILITDMIQGLIMIFSTIILLFAVINYGGGIDQITTNLININEKIIPFGATGSLTPSYVSSFWVLVGVGVIGIPQIAINSMLYKNKRSLKQSIIVGSIVIFIVMFGVHLIGVMARGVFPDIKDYDSVIPIITLKVLPWYLAALVLAAPMAAIITTVNAQFLLISSALVKDLLFNSKVVKEKITGKKIPIFVYGVNILVILLIMLLSMRPPSLIVNVNLFAFGGLEATFLWPILLGLYWKKAEKYGALSSIVVGLISYILVKTVYVIKFIEPVVISLLISFVVFVIVSIVVNKKQLKK